MDKILQGLKDFEKDKIIEFLCKQLAENVEMCPGALYDYSDKHSHKSLLCVDCPGHDIDEESTALCWLKLANHDALIEE